MKFSIRDIMLVTVIVALVLGWWLDRQGLVRWGSAMERDRERAIWDAESLKRDVEKKGGGVTIGSDGVHINYLDPDGGHSQNSYYFYSKLAK